MAAKSACMVAGSSAQVTGCLVRPVKICPRLSCCNPVTSYVLLYLPCMDSVGLVGCGRPCGELLGSGTALGNLKNLQKMQ
jgi:hypothetical protein